MQIGVSVSDELGEILEELSQATGQSKSALCARYIYMGAFDDVERQNKLKYYRHWKGQIQGGVEVSESESKEND